jgi:hypothetical protein
MVVVPSCMGRAPFLEFSSWCIFIIRGFRHTRFGATSVLRWVSFLWLVRYIFGGALVWALFCLRLGFVRLGGS